MIEKVLQKILACQARMLIKKHKPLVIGVTGSYGKTSSRDAIAHAISSQFSVRSAQHNLNNEYGVPLTVIGAEAPGKSIALWARVFVRWVRQMYVTDYPSVLVLEYGVDQPGDMGVLTSIVAPHIAVITAIAAVHQENFDDLGAIAREKGGLFDALVPYDGDITDLHGMLPIALINADTAHSKDIIRRTSASVYTYSVGGEADFTASHIHISVDAGAVFKFNMIERSMPVRLPQIVGKHTVSAVMAALGVAHILKLNLVGITGDLTQFASPPGRMRLLSGGNDVMIIDDTYNASPDSTQAALVALADLSSGRTIAILGDMLELGPEERDLHLDTVQCAVRQKIDIVCLVGVRMSAASSVLLDAGYVAGETMFVLDSPLEAADVAVQVMQPGDAVLIKGSQGMRMEMVTARIISPEVDVSRALCRQNNTWLQKPFFQP